MDGGHHAFGQHLVPMLHQLVVLAIIVAQLGQVIAVRHVVLEQLGERRKAGVDRIPHRVDELGLGEQQVDQPDEEIIGEQLVGDARMVACPARDLLDIAARQQLHLRRRDLLHHLRIFGQGWEAVAQQPQ